MSCATSPAMERSLSTPLTVGEFTNSSEQKARRHQFVNTMPSETETIPKTTIPAKPRSQFNVGVKRGAPDCNRLIRIDCNPTDSNPAYNNKDLTYNS
jgi:hypothetical protein